MALKTDCRLALFSADRALERGFDRLKGEALDRVFEGWPVGDYYEAALPGRDAFCMRDVSHQCMGAQALGLGAHNYNMLHKFAAAISPARDYCSYWEIDRFDRPCPVDYTDDGDFWYNLPANFDVLDAVYRMYRWSGDARYLTDPDFQCFCAWTMEQYIRRWDRDGTPRFSGTPSSEPFLPSCPDQEGRKGPEEGVTENLSVPLGRDRDFGELCGSHQGCQVPFRPPIPNVCSSDLRGESRDYQGCI